MDAIRNWLTPARRDSIYTVVAALAPILVTAGVLSPDHVEPIMVIVAAVLQAAAGIMALVTLRPTEAARWFGTVGRGIIYGGAVTVSGAVVALGIITEDFAAGALNYLSMGLTALASILAVVTPKEVKVSPDEIPVVGSAIVLDGAIVEPVVEGGVNAEVEAIVTEDPEKESVVVDGEIKASGEASVAEVNHEDGRY